MMHMDIVYDKKTIILHWLCAFLIIGLWSVAQTIDWFPKGTLRIWIRSLHIFLGALLAITIAYRVYCRITAGTTLHPLSSGWRQKISKSMHHLLYLLMIVTVILGLLNTWVRGDNLFNVFRLPAFAPGNSDLRHQVEDLHALAANALAVVASLHACVGLAHHFILKDAVLSRMLPEKTIKRDASSLT